MALYTRSDGRALWELQHGEPGMRTDSAEKYLCYRLAGYSADDANTRDDTEES